MKKDYEKIIEAAHAGGKIVKKYFGVALEKDEKSTAADFRTKADLESEKAILEILEKNFPDYSIHSEETGFIDKESEYCFFVDPLDGTNNFSIGIPNFTVSIALFYQDEVIFGVIYQPILNETFWAEKDGGAYRDSEKIRVNDEADLRQTTIGHACGYIHDAKELLGIQERLREGAKIKRWLENWSVAYDFCLLAMGRIEAAIERDNDIYDFAAGRIIAREAGATITDFSGKPDTDKNTIFLATNGRIHNELLGIIKKP